MLTLDEALRNLPRAPSRATKTASVVPDSPAGQVRALAEAVRAIPAPRVTWASLNAVKEAGFRQAPPTPPTRDAPVEDDRAGLPLRKLAHALRCEEDARAVHLYKQSALALRALRGLTLLRERISSP